MNMSCCRAVCLSLVFTSLGIAHMRDKEPISLLLTVKKGDNPLGDKYATLEIKNNGDKNIEIWSQLSGASSCLDVAVFNAKGTRVSHQFYRRSISSPTEEPRLFETIPSGKSIKIIIKLFEGIEDDDLKPGKYKCYIRFEYKTLKLNANSEEIEVEVTKTDIGNRDK